MKNVKKKDFNTVLNWLRKVIESITTEEQKIAGIRLLNLFRSNYITTNCSKDEFTQRMNGYIEISKLIYK